MLFHEIVSRTVCSHGRAQALKSCFGPDAWHTVILSLTLSISERHVLHLLPWDRYRLKERGFLFITHD